MQWIEIMTGIGIGRKCLIIGGGLSVKDFDFTGLDNVVKICINNAFANTKIDYLVYNDNAFVRWWKANSIPEGIKVIGEANNPYPKTDYYFRNENIGCVSRDNTGLKAIMIAKKIMNFDEIYLIGFDFHTKEINGKKQSHFYGDEYGENKKYPEFQQVQDHYKHLPKMLEQFDRFPDMQGIYNCNEDSSLKKYPYKLLRGETNGSNSRTKHSEILAQSL